ncbi:tryptophan halogenase family protein [Asticcacaulis machinosus]|uniref:Tryptophan 7-halogenase n=1 Tax=Asticcacaulis machinosus TaxID=2984211 RepID=A0ABT5HHX0_9CAUL|nr:tryptophan 7-halogenase [Asticcacaulis machinosus]
MTTTDQHIRRILIVGGGTAGWMAAAGLSRLARSGQTEIILVESDSISTVGVGEATIPSIIDFNRALGIDEDEFVRATQGTFKLGIEFVDWNRNGDRYIHPFGFHGLDIEGIKFHQFWLKALLSGVDPGPIEDYCLSAIAAKMGRFHRPAPDAKLPLSTLKYAFHFDAGLYAQYLRRYAEARGVTRVEGTIADVKLDSVSGFIEAVTLSNGECLDGDFFIDCSGFQGLLISGALGTGYEDWSHWLPCNRAAAVPSALPDVDTPYTRSTKDLAGWRWRIPLQHRVGNGYVYCRDYLSDDDAKRALLRHLDGAPLAEPRILSFTTGRRTQAWTKNCVALGLAGGFLEPLESTSIHMIASGISRLLSLFPDRRFHAEDIAEYNRLTSQEYELVRDFIILHYKTMTEATSPFWAACRAMEIPESLRNKIELFKANGRIFRNEADLFTLDSWVSVFLGQGTVPQGYDPLVNIMDFNDVQSFMTKIKVGFQSAASSLSLHRRFIEQNCAFMP